MKLAPTITVALAFTLRCVGDAPPERDAPRIVRAAEAPPLTPDPPETLASPRGLSDLCARFVAHLSDCGTALPAARCEALVGARNPALAERFACYVRTPCGADGGCAAGDPVTAMRARSESLCGDGSFSDGLAALIARTRDDGRPDRVAALRVCEPLRSCEALRACVNAWIDAVER